MRKLDIAAVLRHAIGVLSDFAFVMRATAVWFIVLVVASAFAAALRTYFSVGLIVATIDAFAFAACAVNVHRAILLDESPVLARLSRFEWRYMLRSIWITLPALVAVIIGAIVISLIAYKTLGSRSQISQIAQVALGAAVAGVMLLLILPLSLSLPAAAVGRFDFTAANSMRAATGNVLRLFVLALIGMLPAIIGSGLEWLASAALGPALGGVLTVLIDAAMSVVVAVIDAAFLSFAYRGLAEGDPLFVRQTGVPSSSGV